MSPPLAYSSTAAQPARLEECGDFPSSPKNQPICTPHPPCTNKHVLDSGRGNGADGMYTSSRCFSSQAPSPSKYGTSRNVRGGAGGGGRLFGLS